MPLFSFDRIKTTKATSVQTIQLYSYKKHLPHSRGKQESWIVDGPVDSLKLAIGNDEYMHLFGGYLVTADTTMPDKPAYKGVWGRDMVSKFKRTLTERGFDVRINDINGNERVIRQMTHR